MGNFRVLYLEYHIIFQIVTVIPHSFQFRCVLFVFSCLIAGARTMLNRNSEIRHLCHVPEFCGKAVNILLLSTMLPPWKESYDQTRQHIKKKRHYFVNKCPSSQVYGLYSSHVWMWEVNSKESWAQKNWWLSTVVLKKTPESPVDYNEIQLVHPKGNQSCVFIGGRTDVEAETPIFWPPDVKSWLIWKAPDVGKDWRQEEKGTTEDEMVRWHHRLNGHEFG